MSTDAVWFLQDDTERAHPHSVADLKARIEAGDLSPDAYVQHAMLPTWVPLVAVKGLAEVVAARRKDAAASAPSPAADTPWMITVDGRQDGPMSKADLARRARRGLVDKDTLVWREGMESWRPLGEIDALKSVLPGPESITATGQIRVVDRAQAKARLSKATPRTLDDCRRFLERSPAHEPTLRVLENMVRTGRNALGAVELLEEVLSPREAWDRLMASWRNLLRVVRGAHERTDLRMRMGQAAEGPLDAPVQALAIFTSALRESPQRADVQAALRRISERLDEHDQTIEFVDTQLDAREGADKAALARFAAELYQAWRDDTRAAADRTLIAARIEPTTATLDQLEQLLEALDDWAPWTEALRAAADQVPDEDRVPYLHRLANAWQIRLQKPGRALSVYRELLDLAPDDPQALDALKRMHLRGIEPAATHSTLERLLTKARDWRGLKALDVAHLPHVAPGADRAAVLQRLATLCRTRLADPRAALDFLARAVAQRPDDAAIREAYVEQAAGLGALDDAVRTLEALHGEHPTLGSPLALSLFTLHRERTRDSDAARRWAEILIEAGAPADRLALLPALDAWPDLTRAALEQLIAEPPADWDPNRGRLLLAQAVAADDEPRALRLYDAILADAPNHLDALTAVTALHANAERWDAWFASRRALADAQVDDDARVDIWRQSARKAADLARHDDAAERWRRILAAHPDDSEALDGLEAANAAQDDWAGVADVLERRRAGLPEDEGLWITRRLAVVYADRLDDRPRAAACWRALVRANPDDADARRALARVATGAEAITLWAGLFNADPRDSEAARTLAALHREADAVREALEVQLRHADAAVENAEAIAGLKAVLAESDAAQIDLGPTPYQRILARAPDDAEAAEGLARVYARQEDWTALARSLQTRIAQARDGAARETLSRQLATVQVEQLSNPGAAFETLREAFASAPTDALAPELARLAALSGRWPALLEAFETAVATMAPALAEPLHRRLAEWYAGPHDDAAAAVEHYGAVLAVRPDDAETVAALEALFADGRARGPILALLEPVYVRTERRAELAEMLADTLPKAGPDRVPALRRLGALYDDLGKGREALETFGQALEADPADAGLQERLVETGTRIDRLDLVADALGRALLNAERPPEVVALGERLAPILDGLGQKARSIAVLQRILDADPHNQFALAGLDAVAEADGDLVALAGILERRVEGASRADRPALQARLAQTWEALERPDAAIAIWLGARAERKNADAPLDALDRLYEETEDWDALVAIRLERAARAPKQARIALVESLLPIADAHLDGEAALQIRQRLVELAPTVEHIDGLEARLRVEARWDALAALADGQLRESDDPVRWFAVLATAQTALGQQLEALESWRQVLDREPAHVPALEAAHALYVERGEAAGQAQTAHDLSCALPDDDPRAPLLAREAARLFEAQGRGHEAEAAWLQVRALEPDATDAREALVTHYAETGAWEKLRSLLQSVLARTQSSDARLGLHLRVAELSLDRLDDPETARRAYETALSESPGSPRATVALGRLYQQTEDWAAWVELAMARLSDVQHPEARREIYAEAAEVLADKLDSPAHALALLLRAVIELPDDGLGERIDSLAGALERYADAARAYESALKEAKPRHKRALSLRLAGWLEGPLDQPAAAVTVYRALLAERADDDAALSALHRLFEAGHARESIAEELAQRHRAAGDWERLHELLAASVPAGPPAARAQAWKQLGEVAADKLDAPKRALAWYQRALNDAPDDADARGRLLRLGRQLDRVDQVAISFARALPRAEAAVRPLGYALADLYDQLGDPEGSERTYELLLERLGPAESAALAALEARYTAAGRWSELASRLKAAVEAAEDDYSAADFSARLARIYEHRLHQNADAISAWERVLTAEPGHDEALASLARLHQAQQDYRPLFEVYRREADADPSVRGARCAEMARIAAEHLGEPDTAATLWQESLDAGGDPAVALPALQALHAQAERWGDVARVVEQRLQRNLGVPLPLLQTRARALQRDPSAGDVRAAWHAVLAEAPTDLEALRAAWQLEEGEDHAATAALARRFMAALPHDAPERSQVARARGRASLAASDHDDARVAWEAVLATDPGDPEAEASLSTIYAEQRDEAALVALRARQADRAETAADRIEAQIALAAVQDRAGDGAAAASALDAALEIRPTDEALAERIATIHFTHDRFAAGGAALVRRATELEPAEAQSLHLDVAQRLAHDLERPREAFDVAAAGFQLKPSDVQAGALIEGLATASSRWQDAIELYRAHADALDVEGPAGRLRLASWVAGQVEDEEAAATEYEAILAQAPDNEDAAVKLGVILRKLGRLERLVDLMLQRAHHLSGDAATRLRLEAAELAEAQLGPAVRIRAWDAVLEGEPNHAKAFAALEAVHREQENWSELVKILSMRADRAEDDEEITALRLAVADLHADHLDNEDAAMSAYRRALVTDPQNRRALQGVERVLERREDWPELIRFHEGRLAVAEPTERHAIYARIAEIQSEKQHDPAAAEGTERVMRQTAGPRNRGRSTHALEQVYMEGGRWDDLAALYERRLKVIPEGAQERSLRTTLASIYAEKLNDTAGAIAVLEPLLASEDADHAEVRQTLDTLYSLHASREDWPGCAEVLKRMARTRRKKEERIDCFMRIGNMYADKLEDPIGATQWWREALEIDNHYQPAVRAIDSLHERIRRQHDEQKRQQEREQARIDAERARQTAAARTSGQVTGPISGQVAGQIPPQKAEPSESLDGSASIEELVDVSEEGVPEASIDEMPVTPPPPREPQPFRMEARPGPERESGRWLMPLIAVGLFVGASAAILISVWPKGDRLEPAWIAFDEEITEAWAKAKPDDGDTGEQGGGDIPKSIGPQEVKRGRSADVDVQAESEVIKRIEQITERNLIAVETALMNTGIDYEAMLTPVGPEGSPVDEGPVGGPPIDPPKAWVTPLGSTIRILSPYGPRGREHHDGIDYLAKVGTPVRAIADGEIIFRQTRASWEKREKFIKRDGKTIKSPAWRAGVYLEIRHDDGKVSRYMHLHHIADRMTVGTRVRQKDVVGYVGRTAVEHSHTHLHFEMREPARNGGRYGPAINPNTLIGSPSKQPDTVGADLFTRTIDIKRAPGGAQVRRQVEQKLKGLSLLEKMDRLEAVKTLLNQLPLGAPVDNYRLSSTFGNRTDPETGKPEFHPGVDIPGQLGTVIKATAPGKVISAGWKGLYGRVVEIDHGNGIRTRYGHLNQTLVRPGQAVTVSDRIGEMGDSGRSTGPHVHYEVLVNDEYEDPLTFLRAGSYLFKR